MPQMTEQLKSNLLKAKNFTKGDDFDDWTFIWCAFHFIFAANLWKQRPQLWHTPNPFSSIFTYPSIEFQTKRKKTLCPIGTVILKWNSSSNQRLKWLAPSFVRQHRRMWFVVSPLIIARHRLTNPNTAQVVLSHCIVFRMRSMFVVSLLMI